MEIKESCILKKSGSRKKFVKVFIEGADYEGRKGASLGLIQAMIMSS
jgi:hypothetical protein